MPIPLRTPAPNARLETLLKVEQTPPPRGEPGVTPCPLMQKKREGEEKAKEEKKKKPIRLLFWHLYELGGGFNMPPKRPQYVVDACARLIQKLDLHVVVLQGLTRTIQELPTRKESGKGSYICFAKAPKDTGPEEAQRILEKLQQLDAGAGWQMKIPKARGTGDFLYHRSTTVAFLYASAKGLGFQKIDLIQTSKKEEAGLTGTLVAATFDAPDHQSQPLCVMTPLGLATPERPWERPREETPQSELAPTAELPKSAIVFASASRSLDELHEELDAEFLQPGPEGTVLGDEFWKVVAEKHDGLLGNFAALNLGNVRLQDREMHWEALEAPEHVQVADRLPGFLADGMAIVHHGSGAPPKVQEMRVVDLVFSSLPPDAIDKLKAKPSSKTADGGPPPESSALVADRATYRAESVRGPEPEKDPANELSECGYFSRAISRHWPLVAQLLLESE